MSENPNDGVIKLTVSDQSFSLESDFDTANTLLWLDILKTSMLKELLEAASEE